ncbi:hypothetical protein GQ53DRAFT_473877 [Thozetella sp. PMI_491]|nr:hypothetical protein GQ53DRAFT_473877 [Thozetella sp. PMI_491]
MRDASARQCGACPSSCCFPARSRIEWPGCLCTVHVYFAVVSQAVAQPMVARRAILIRLDTFFFLFSLLSSSSLSCFCGFFRLYCCCPSFFFYRAADAGTATATVVALPVPMGDSPGQPTREKLLQTRPGAGGSVFCKKRIKQLRKQQNSSAYR